MKIINDILKTSNNFNTHTEFLINNSLTSNPHNIADSFNSFFTSIGSDLARPVPSFNNTTQDFLGPHIPSSIFFAPTDRQEILQTINNLKQTCSPGQTCS